jgi:Cof subfamily protein (haloacid dehalogenase superfamily)
VTDLDGTLLNGKSEISDRTLAAIGQFQLLGGFYTYATGRTDESARVFAELAGVKIPGIAFNGGKVVSHIDGGVIYETFMDAGQTKQAYNALRERGKDVIIYLDSVRYIAEYTDVIDRYLSRVRHSLYIVNDIDEVVESGGRKLKKLLVIDPKQEDDLIIDAVKPIFGDNFNFVKSDPQYYEFIPPGTSKGIALEVLAGHLGISLTETIAVGDHRNDISMIKAAGLGVAVANAEREAIEAAGFVTASNADDGVALVIEKLLRGELP